MATRYTVYVLFSLANTENIPLAERLTALPGSHGDPRALSVRRQPEHVEVGFLHVHCVSVVNICEGKKLVLTNLKLASIREGKSNNNIYLHL